MRSKLRLRRARSCTCRFAPLLLSSAEQIPAPPRKEESYAISNLLQAKKVYQ